MPKVMIYSDGSSRGNPGPGGFGTIIRFEDSVGTVHEKEISSGYKITTNNRMELLGVIAGLEALNKPCLVTVTSDSKYVIDAFNKKWIYGWIKSDFRRNTANPVKNIDLWERLIKLVNNQEKVEFIWIKGHNGHVFNERCDVLATSAADSSNLLDDDGFKM